RWKWIDAANAARDFIFPLCKEQAPDRRASGAMKNGDRLDISPKEHRVIGDDDLESSLFEHPHGVLRRPRFELPERLQRALQALRVPAPRRLRVAQLIKDR